jgi:hypothetical protein
MRPELRAPVAFQHQLVTAVAGAQRRARAGSYSRRT